MCQAFSISSYAFLSYYFFPGDTRTNEQVGLMAVHTVLLRLHNYLVEKLAVINSHWNGDKLYEASSYFLLQDNKS